MPDDTISVFILNSRDWLEIFLSAAIPVLLMLITLIATKNDQKKALTQQANEHQTMLNEQRETNRLSILPIFDISGITGKMEKTKLVTTEITHHVLDIRLKNVGCGVAMCTYTEWAQTGNSEQKAKWHPVYESENAIYTCYKDFHYDNSIATLDKEINVLLIRERKNDNPVFEDSIILPVCFIDVIGNHYKQEITISLIINAQTGEVSASDIMPLPPVLRKSSNDNPKVGEK